MARSVYRLAQQRTHVVDDVVGAADPQVRVLLAGEGRVGLSSAVALERTATATSSTRVCSHSWL